QTDLDYALNGVTAVLEADGEPLWEGWLPHASTGVSAELTSGSADHDIFRDTLAEADALSVSTQLDLRGMLQPDVQPGSELDFEYPAETVTVLVRSASPVSVKTDPADNCDVEVTSDETGRSTARITVRNDETKVLPLQFRVQRGESRSALSLELAWYTA